MFHVLYVLCHVAPISDHQFMLSSKIMKMLSQNVMVKTETKYIFGKTPVPSLMITPSTWFCSPILPFHFSANEFSVSIISNSTRLMLQCLLYYLPDYLPVSVMNPCKYVNNQICHTYRTLIQKIQGQGYVVHAHPFLPILSLSQVSRKKILLHWAAFHSQMAIVRIHMTNTLSSRDLHSHFCCISRHTCISGIHMFRITMLFNNRLQIILSMACKTYDNLRHYILKAHAVLKGYHAL